MASVRLAYGALGRQPYVRPSGHEYDVAAIFVPRAVGAGAMAFMDTSTSDGARCQDPRGVRVCLYAAGDGSGHWARAMLWVSRTLVRVTSVSALIMVLHG